MLAAAAPLAAGQELESTAPDDTLARPPPSEIVFEHVILTTQPIEEPELPEHFKQMLEMFPAGRMLMFSSDFPHWDGDTPDFAARSFPVSLRNRVMYETARELYRLPLQKSASR